MDWQTLSDKLKSLGVGFGKDLPGKPATQSRYPIDKVVHGDFEDTLFGSIFFVEQRFSLDHVHGSVSLFPSSSITTLARWARIPQVTSSAINNIVFLDTETTGLAGGTGTLAFMVGVGRFTEEGFTLKQYFMRNPAEEAAMLAALTRFSAPLDAIVSYNGKAFDVPLLRTRYTMQAFEFPMEGTPHFDLLALARRLWKDRLPSCSLSIIENQVLGVFREEEDIPGSAIPELYTDYLRSGDARPMRGIFYHNAIDILSLAALFSHTASLLENPASQNTDQSVDIASIGKLFQFLGDSATALLLFEQSLAANLPEDIYWNTIERASMLFKHQGNLDSAIQLWQKAAEAGKIFAFEELAKYYEHSARDIQAAILWTSKAIELLEGCSNQNIHPTDWRTRFSHRMDRLQRKTS